MLLGADKGGSAAAGPIPSAPSPDTPLAPPPLPEGMSDPVQSDPGEFVAPRQPGAAWPAQGVSPAMRGLLQALVQQLAPAAPPRVVVVQPWGGCGGRRLPADPDCPRCKPGWWARAMCSPSRASAPSRPRCVCRLRGCRRSLRACRTSTGLSQRAAGRLCRAAPGVDGRLVCAGPAADGAGGRCHVVLCGGAHQRPAGAGTGPLGGCRRQPGLRARATAGPQRPVAADAGAAGQRLRARGGEADQRRRARGHCDTPGCPYAGRAPCEQPFCHAMRGWCPCLPCPRWAADTDLPSTVSLVGRLAVHGCLRLPA